MKNKDVIILRKILDYCAQVKEACDIFAHQYSNLDCESAWSTIQNDLPDLKSEINRVLEGIEK